MALQDLVAKPKTAPPIITIVSTPGCGKTTLGALFPKAIFIMAEDGSATFDSWDDDVKPSVLPQLPRARYRAKNGALLPQDKQASTRDKIREYLTMLIMEEHPYKTLVIDTITTLDRLYQHELCERDGVDNVADACGGFHKGYDCIAEWHGEIKSACDILREKKGMTIIFLAHTGIKRMKNRPDVDDYTVFSIDMHDKSIPVYTNQVDAVIYIKNLEYVKSAETNKKGQITKYGRVTLSGDRVLITSGDGAIGYVGAKNRYKLDQEIDLPEGENPLLSMIPYFVKNKEQQSDGHEKAD